MDSVLPAWMVAEVRLIAEPCFHKYALFYVPRFAELRWKVRLKHEDIERLCRESGGRLRVSEATLRKFVEMSPLSLVDRRTYNLLIAHAWDRIGQPVTHVIAKSELRGLHESNDRVGAASSA